jgi:hypothetical protein
MLDPQSQMALALSNKSFLFTVGLSPGSMLFTDPNFRQTLFMQMGDLITSIKKGRIDPPRRLEFGELFDSLIPTFTEVWNTIDGNHALVRKLPLKQQFHQMRLPWGCGNRVLMKMGDREDGNAVRLVFSHDTRIVCEETDGDLTYNEIVKTIERLPPLVVAREMRDAFANLSRLQQPFFGELAILLVGLEGTQNNLMVLNVPMVNDLVNAGALTWSGALFSDHKGLPALPFAGDGKSKPKNPMSLQAQLILQRGPNVGGYMAKLFDSYMEKQYDLHRLFLRTFLPGLNRVPRAHRPRVCAFAIMFYLMRVYGIHGHAATAVQDAVFTALSEGEYDHEPPPRRDYGHRGGRGGYRGRGHDHGSGQSKKRDHRHIESGKEPTTNPFKKPRH